jgi:hypothetical protein
VRTLDCSCGQHLEAGNDEELFEKAREHVEAEIRDDEVSGLVLRRSW